MLEEWLRLFILLWVAGVIGYLAQRTGLCMIRGVMQFREGQPMLILAMLLCGICVWAIAPVAISLGLTFPLVRYDWHYSIALGGLIFGLGTAANGGCAVSTMSRLTRGDMHMLATMLGWVIGWCMWALWVPSSFKPTQLGTISTFSIIIEVVLLAIATIWAMTHSSEGRKLWLSIMAIGLLSGILFMLQPHWSPSSLLQHVASATLHDNQNSWPSYDRYMIVLALLVGMITAAWLSRRFVWKPLYIGLIVLHLVCGTAMGIGASLALGGNDTQLLLALPGFSPAGILAVIFMLMGIYCGILLQDSMMAFRKKLKS